MMSSNNILSASDGKPVVAPHQDIVLGCYYLTLERTALPTADDTEALHKLSSFSSIDEAVLAYNNDRIGLHTHIRVRLPRAWATAHRPSEELIEGHELVT